jgi:hypothetical protein
MSRIFAIAVIAIRSAVRSRIVILLLGCLLLAIVGLPLTIKGDGTLAGHVQILIGYTLGAATLILSIATVWAGCAAVSTEIENRSIHMVVTKPVHRLEIWLGKWLGLMLVNAALLALCGAATYGLLRWTTAPGRLTPQERQTLREDILTARREIHPAPLDIEDTVREEYERVRAENQIPSGISAAEASRAIRETLTTQAFSVPGGGKRQWAFSVPPDLAPGQPLLFRYRLSTSQVSGDPVAGLWTALRGSAAIGFVEEVESVPGGVRSFKIPDNQVSGSGPLTVEYANVNPTPVTVLFAPDDGLLLYIYETTFEANFVRALIVVLCHLAFLTALGVSAGSLFSMPVASFISFCAVLILQTGSYIQSVATQEIIFQSHDGAGTGPTFWDAFFRLVFKGMNALVAPLQAPDPLGLLATGQYITGTWLAHAVLVKALLYGGILALVSAWLLNRREIALPSA